MEKQDFSLSKSGTAVWTRVSGVWWPGEITTDYPKQLIPEKKEKDKICVVKFCQENDYQVVFKQSEIKLYTKEEREDLIRKGLSKLKSEYLENFKKDVNNAEKLIGGDPEILHKISLTPRGPKLPAYAGLFSSTPPAPPPTITPKHGQIKLNFLKRAHQSPKKPNATGTPANVSNSDKQFVCDKCGFGTDRVGTLTAHLKSHTMPFGFGVEGPPRPAPVQVGRVFPKTTPNPSTLISSTRLKTVPVAEVAPSPKKATPKKSPVKAKETIKSVQKTLPPKKRKMTSEVAKKEILADWVGEDGNEIPRDDTSNYHEKSDEEDSVQERKIPRRTEKELADTFDALLNATRSEAPEAAATKLSSVNEISSKTETTVAAAVVEVQPEKSLRSKEQEVKATTPTPEPVPVQTRERRGAATRRSGTVQEPAITETPASTPKPAAIPKTRSSARNQDRAARSEANAEPILSSTKRKQEVSQPETKDKDDELLDATEALLDETKMPEAPETPARLANSSTKASRKETVSDAKKLEVTPAPAPAKTEEKRETSPKRTAASERSLRSTSPPKPASPTKSTATTVSSPEKKAEVKPPTATVTAAKSPKSPPLPKLIPTPAPSAQPVTASTPASAAVGANQKVIIKPSTNNTSASEVAQASVAVTPPAPAPTSPSKVTANAPMPRATSAVKVAVSSAAPPSISAPPKLVPVGTKSRVPSSPQASASQQIAVSTSAPKPSTVKVQVNSSPPKLVASPGVSFVTPNEKVVVSQIIPASVATTGTVPSTKVLVSSITPTTARAAPSTAPPASASQKVLVTSTASASVRPTSLSNNVHTTSRSPAAILSRTPQARLPAAPLRQQVAMPGRGSVPPILRSPKTTTPARSQAVGQGAGQQIVVATKSAPEKPAPTIAFAQKSTVPQVAVTSLPQKTAPTIPALASSQATASRQATAVATAVKSAAAPSASPKPPNILAQKSTIGSSNVVAQKSTVAVAVTQNTLPAAAQKPTTVGSYVATPQNNSAPASQKPPVSSLPPLGPPPPIPGIATSVSEEMLAAAAAQPSIARKRPAPKPKAPKSPPKKVRPDGSTAGAASAITTAGGQVFSSEQVITQAVELQQQGIAGQHLHFVGADDALTGDEVGQVIHMIPVHQGDGTTRYVMVRLEGTENGKTETMEMLQTDHTNARVAQPQDHDRAAALYVDGEGNVEEAIASVQNQEEQEHRQQQGQVLQLAQTTEAEASGNAITYDNIADAQQLFNSGGQAVLIQQENGQHILATGGNQQFALDQQQLDALGGGGDGSEVYYIVDYNGDGEQQFLQFTLPEGAEGQGEPEAEPSEPPAAQ